MRVFGSFPPQVKQVLAHNFPLPEFPALSHVHDAQATAQHFLEPHTHERFEICYFQAGRAFWHVNGKTYHLKPGDIYITRPGEVHGGRADPDDPFHIFVVGLDVSALPVPGIQAENRKSRAPLKRVIAMPPGSADVTRAVDEAQAFHSAFGMPDEPVIPGGGGFEPIFRRLVAELETPVKPNARSRALKVMMVQAILVELLVYVARCCAAHAEKAAPEGPARLPHRPKFQALLETLRSRLADPPTLPQMAEDCGLSPAHFAVAFKRETGLTPMEYVTRLRIDAAAERLVSSRRASVTDIALDLGFSSAQYFSIVFRRVKRCSPSEWRGAGGPAAARTP